MYDLVLALPMLFSAPYLARTFGAPPPVPLVNAQLNGVFTSIAQNLANLRSVPRAKTAVVIRSVFGRFLFAARPGDASTSQLHDVGELIGGFEGGKYQSYGALVAR